MAKKDEFAFMDATAQAELARKKEVKPIELVEAAIGRAERLNPKLNAIVTPMYEEARKVAKGTLPDGPFRGVPFLLKDLGATYGGVRQTAGSAFLKDFVPDHDSELVARHKKAGLVIIGKTNTPEFGIVPTTEPHFFGPARNPWNTERSTGGSSGGSAAAVAAGIVPFAHANDGGGSIRIPASCCGVFGLKPTRARNSLGPDLGDMLGGLVAEHAVTRSVRDSAALLDSTAGPVLGDPYWAPPQERPYAKEVKAKARRLKIAFTTESGTGTPMSQDSIDAVRDAAKLCEELGHDVAEATPGVAGELVSQMFMTLYAAGHSWAISAFSMLSGQTPSEEHFEPLTWALYQMGKQVSASDYLMAVAGLQQISRQIAKFMVDYDIWLNATLAEPPLPLGALDSPPDDPLYGLMRSGAYVPYTPICNFTGQPAMSVPLYWNKEGLPIGAHFVARFGDEATLFRLAAQLEQARPWANRRPPVSA